MKESGSFGNAFNINMDDASVAMNIGVNSAFVKDNYYVFGGHSYGYKTLYQNKTYDIAAPFYDSYLFKYDPRNGPDCFYSANIRSGDINKLAQKYTNVRRDDGSKDWYSKTRPYGLFKQMNSYFDAYGAQYNGHFDLQKSFIMPRMCSQYSYNLTEGVQYYRGQKE